MKKPKIAKIMAFYFGIRRGYPHNIEGVKELFLKQIKNHETINPGVKMDLIVVNHDKGDEEVKSFLEIYNGHKIKTGKVIILHRPFISGDLSFGSYKYAFHILQNKYKYWFFCEDDIEIIEDGVEGELLKLFNSEENIGFVAALDFGPKSSHPFNIDEEGFIIDTAGLPSHAHGGIGLTSTEKINTVVENIPSYLLTPNNTAPKNIKPCLNIDPYDRQESEVDFTNDFVKSGLKLKAFPSNKRFYHIRVNTKI